MRSDALLAFVPIGSPLSLVGATGTTFYSDTIDLLGQGVGTAPLNIYGTLSNSSLLFGAPDAGGVGGLRPELNVTIGTALATSNSATLTPSLQAAPDTASTYQPGTWQTIVSGPAYTAAQGVANTVIFRVPWLPPFPENLRPRYLRLGFATPTSTAFTAGTIASAIVTFCRDDWFQRQAARNYAVS